MSLPPEHDNDDGDPWAVLLMLGAVVIIVILGLLLLWKMRQNQQMQQCLMTGRRDCAPIAIPDSR